MAENAHSGHHDQSTAKAGFQRSGLYMPGKKELMVLGMVIAALAIIIAMSISYKFILIGYSLIIIYISLSYMWMWMDGAWVERIPPAPSKWPSVSLIIPSFNSGHTVFDCVDACKKIQYKGKLEIFVVDDGSTDGSYEKLKKIEGITLHRSDKNAGKAAALNWAIPRTKGEIVGCVDSDTYPESHTLDRAIRFFSEDEKVGSVALFICVHKPGNLLQRMQEIEYWLSFGFYFKTVASIEGLYVTPGPMALYRRKVFDQIGLFDEHNLTEDMEIALHMQQVGWKIRTCHSAIAFTEVPSTWRQLFRQRLRWFRGGVMNILKYFDMFLNPKYGTFGLFVLPTTLGSGFFAALFMLWTIMNYGRQLIDWMIPLISNPGQLGIWAIPFPKADPFLLDSAIIFGVVSASLWGYFTYKSFHLANERLSRKHILPLAMLLTVYPIFLGLGFLGAYVQEFSGREYKW
jgi:cellulose synthase/poly-beta-1,6-N-acetylglucosamine synthase-like glycosyltransferase